MVVGAGPLSGGAGGGSASINTPSLPEQPQCGGRTWGGQRDNTWPASASLCSPQSKAGRPARWCGGVEVVTT